MNTKIFKMVGNSKVMVMDNEEFVEYYLQINSSNWYFCVGSKENFDDITEEDAKLIWNEYWDSVNDQEKVVSKYLDDEMEYWEKFKKVTGYEYDSTIDDSTTKYTFNIDERTGVGAMPIPKETKEFFDDKAFVNYILKKISKGHCNYFKRKALKIMNIVYYPFYNNDDILRIHVQFN